MILYMAKSGEKTKVGITSELLARSSNYRTHNPDVTLIEKLSDLCEPDARLIEKLAHEILLVGDSEWTYADEGMVDSAIATAVECVESIRAAQWWTAFTSIPRVFGTPEQAAQYARKNKSAKTFLLSMHKQAQEIAERLEQSH